jgi:hypothetical protein
MRSSSDDQTADELLSGVEESLLLEIGRELHAGDRMGGPLPTNILLRSARLWFAANYTALQGGICPKCDFLITTLRSDAAAATTAIVDLVSTLTIGVPGTTVARLCLQVGLSKFCKSWSPQNG